MATQWIQTTATRVGETRITLTNYAGEGIYIVRAYLPFSDWPIFSEAHRDADEAWSAFRDFQLVASMFGDDR